MLLTCLVLATAVYHGGFKWGYNHFFCVINILCSLLLPLVVPASILYHLVVPMIQRSHMLTCEYGQTK